MVERLSAQFSDGDPLEIDGIIYLVGVQELGNFQRKFKKDEKVNLMHIAICRLLEPYGYYDFDFFDEEGWPHYKVKEQLPPLKSWGAVSFNEGGLGKLFFGKKLYRLMEPKQPYFAVIFTNTRTEGDNGYEQMAQDMEDLARKQPGFLGFESARSSLGISISYWESLESISRWKANMDHKAAQQKREGTMVFMV